MWLAQICAMFEQKRTRIDNFGKLILTTKFRPPALGKVIESRSNVM